MTLAVPLLLAALAGNAQAVTIRHAMVVGVNDGGGSLEPLKYAEQDARRFADLLVELGDFDPEMVTVLYSPDRDTFMDAMELHDRIAARIGEDLFILYYSGHADARGLRLGEEVVRYQDLRDRMHAMQADVRVGVLDACRSGAIVRLKGARVTAPFLPEDELPAEGEAWLTAASADESAQESDQIRGSFFTHYLVSGLRGAADTGDGFVSIEETYRYAYQRTVARTGGTEAGTQHPAYDFRLQGKGELTLTDVRKGLSRVTLPKDIAGEVVVLRLPDRVPVAEVAKPAGEAVNLALAPGRYLFRLRSESGIQEVVVGLSEGAWTTIGRFGPEQTPELAQRKGLDSLTAGLGTLATESQEALDSIDLSHSPWIAAGASVVVPGAGQVYNGQWFKGGLLFVGTASLFGGGLLWRGTSEVDSGSVLGPNFATLMGAGIYGFSIADAAWRASGRAQDFRPRQGLVVTAETGWHPGGEPVPPGMEQEGEDRVVWPATSGVAVDWIMPSGFSLGLDRTGLVTNLDGSRTFNVGSRGTLALDRDTHLRPGVFLALDMRGNPVEDRYHLRPVVGVGANLRWYLTPRYLLQFEARQEIDGGDSSMVFGGGLGVHLFR